MNADIAEVVREAAAWADIEGVEAVAQGRTDDGRDCVQVLVSRSEAAARIPTTFQGYPVVVKGTDVIHAQKGNRT